MFISTFLMLGIIGLMSAQPQTRQSAVPSAAPRQVTGTINKIDAKSVTLTSDGGVNITAVVQESTRIVRLESGQTDIENATPIQLTDLRVGERIQVVGDLLDDAGSISASTIVAMKHSEPESK